MTEFAKMDVFFFIASISMVVLTLLLIVIGIYIAKILKDVKYISAKAKNEADNLSEDIADLRQNIRAEGQKMKHFAKFFGSILRRHKKK